MSIRTFLLAGVMVAALASPALAQVTAPSPAEFEGPIANIDADTITVFGTVVKTDGASFSTPTRAGMTYTQLDDCKQFAGRKIIDIIDGNPDGNPWIGGTGIVVGTTDGSDVTAEEVFLEPAENVLIGRITELPVKNADGTTTGKFRISGTEVVLLPKTATDKSFPPGDSTAPSVFSPCISGAGIKNEFGFEIDPSTLAEGQDAAAEGWFSNDGTNVFYAFLIDGVGTPDPESVPRQVSITRAQCRERTTAFPWTVEWEIRGGVARPPNGVIATDNTVNIGYGTNQTATAVADPANQPFGSWSYRATLQRQQTGCPSSITVRYGVDAKGNPVTATAAVEVRR